NNPGRSFKTPAIPRPSAHQVANFNAGASFSKDTNIMTKSLTLAAALLASTAFGSAAFAAGDYYEGATKSPVVTIDRTETGSIGARSDAARYNVGAQVQAPVDHGDYYEG